MQLFLIFATCVNFLLYWYLILETSIRTEGMVNLLQQMDEWLISEPGQTALIDAVKKSLSEVQELNKARQLEQDQLSIPITL
ncbi:MAG: hypothetical protein EBU46_05450 [Nitrosomonadaceae bacterium]|nr:hypothetical protein [Nitrosomonadaceae bacterium]